MSTKFILVFELIKVNSANICMHTFKGNVMQENEGQLQLKHVKKGSMCLLPAAM